MTGARRHDGDRRAVQRADQGPAVGHERRDRTDVAGGHHRQVEAGAELARATVQHECAHRFVVFRFPHHVGDGGDDLRRQGVGLAVVDVADQDAIALLGGDCC
jgi:hypothetical protein